ncbi:hypothetical protein C1H46_035702 [Malus baccata]|uniref:Uncharacterized protein n=1 Tax=Malus baccata TaxID=106549 RepID=A0A540KX03_MALBA|nr:hypothetical protein C1H46_035702 [Malus baccata]
MDNTNSFLPEPVIESWDPSEPVTVVLHPESNIATPRSRTPMSTSPPDISLSSSSSSTTSFQENSGSSGHGDMDNTNSLLPVIESWDPLSASSISTTRIERKKRVLKHWFPWSRKVSL